METVHVNIFRWPTEILWHNVLGSGLIAMSVGYCLYLYCRYRWSSFDNVPGPPGGHWLWGFLPTILRSEAEFPNVTWAPTYSTTFRYRFLLGVPRLVITDPTTINYISPIPISFPNPIISRATSWPLTAAASWWSAGRLTFDRESCSMLDSPPRRSVKGVVPIYCDKAYELWQKLLDLVEGTCRETPSFTPPQAIDMLREADTELSRTMEALYAIILQRSNLTILQIRSQILRLLPTARMRAMQESL
ncbi:hypothetical protein IAR50_002328 [Cryptococcus sp. DSM 104548]